MNFRRAFIPADRSTHALSALVTWAKPRNGVCLALPVLTFLIGLAVSSFTAAQLPNFLSSEAQVPSAVSIDESTAVTPILDTQTAIVTEQASYTVLGQNLFNGSFGRQQFTGFNPNYRIAVGDKVLLQLWGAVESRGDQVVDAQGNIFIPQVGPVNIAGVLNS